MRRTILLVAGLLAAALAAAAIGQSGAALTAQSAEVSLELGSGELDLASTREGQAVIVNATGLRPGDVRDGEVTVRNDGDVPAALSFEVEGPPQDVPATPALSGVLELVRCAGPGGCPAPQPLSPSGSSLQAAAAAPATGLGTLAPGEARTLHLRLAWPAANRDPGLQGARTAVVLGFTAKAGS